MYNKLFERMKCQVFQTFCSRIIEDTVLTFSILSPISDLSLHTSCL